MCYVGEDKSILMTFMGKDVQFQTTFNVEIKIAFNTIVGEATATLAISITQKQLLPIRCLWEEGEWVLMNLLYGANPSSVMCLNNSAKTPYRFTDCACILFPTTKFWIFFSIRSNSYLFLLPPPFPSFS